MTVPGCPSLPEHRRLIQEIAGSKPPLERRRNERYAYKLESLCSAHPDRTPRSIYLSNQPKGVTPAPLIAIDSLLM
jgi:hypothetical protein